MFLLLVLQLYSNLREKELCLAFKAYIIFLQEKHIITLCGIRKISKANLKLPCISASYFRAKLNNDDFLQCAISLSATRTVMQGCLKEFYEARQGINMPFQQIEYRTILLL